MDRPAKVLETLWPYLKAVSVPDEDVKKVTGNPHHSTNLISAATALRLQSTNNQTAHRKNRPPSGSAQTPPSHHTHANDKPRH